MDFFHLKQKNHQEFPGMFHDNPSSERPQCLYKVLISTHFTKKRSKHKVAVLLSSDNSQGVTEEQ